MPFQGVGKQALPFFKALAFHQSKDWFEENRAIYEADIKGPLGELAEELGAAFAKAKIPIKGDKKSLFRLHRDIRFSKDKSPYKTHQGLAMTRGGSKNDPGVVYFHLSPEGCFAAAGFYHPEPLHLARMRRAIAREPGSYRRMLSALAKKKLELSNEDAAKRASAEFAAVAEPDLAAGVRLEIVFLHAPDCRQRDLCARTGRYHADLRQGRAAPLTLGLVGDFGRAVRDRRFRVVLPCCAHQIGPHHAGPTHPCSTEPNPISMPQATMPPSKPRSPSSTPIGATSQASSASPRKSACLPRIFSTCSSAGRG